MSHVNEQIMHRSLYCCVCDGKSNGSSDSGRRMGKLMNGAQRNHIAFFAKCMPSSVLWFFSSLSSKKGVGWIPFGVSSKRQIPFVVNVIELWSLFMREILKRRYSLFCVPCILDAVLNVVLPILALHSFCLRAW